MIEALAMAFTVVAIATGLVVLAGNAYRPLPTKMKWCGLFGVPATLAVIFWMMVLGAPHG